MSRFTMSGSKSDDEKFEDAKRFLPILLVRFPDYSDFQLHDIITTFKETDPIEEKAMINCQNQIKQLLDKLDYVKEGTFNRQIHLTDKGRTEKKRLIEEVEDQQRKSQSSPDQFSFSEYMNAVIYSMLDIDEPMLYAPLHYIVSEKYPHIPTKKVLIELERLKLINISDSRDGRERYILHEPVKMQIRNLPSPFKNKPYEFFITEDERKSSESIEKHNLELQKLRDEVFDYREKWEREKKHYHIALIGVIIEGILLIVSLFHGKS